MRVEWGLEIPRELRSVLEPFVARYADILPSWCYVLQILPTDAAQPKDGDVTDCFMAMSADYKYRRAKMFVNAHFLTLEEIEREQTVIHEFVHVLNAPLIDFTDQLITIVEEKSPGMKKMLNVLQEAGMEAATEDTAALLWRLTESRR